MGFSLDSVDCHGVYVVRTITSTLRYIPVHLSTLLDARPSRVEFRHAGIACLDKAVQAQRLAAKKQKRPHIEASTLSGHALALVSLLNKP